MPNRYQFSFGDQLRRAALSMPSNIAEGAGRRGKRDSANFYSFSNGSVNESVNIVIILDKLKLIDHKRFDVNKVLNDSEEIVKMLFGISK